MQGSISKRERHKRKNSSRQKYEQMAVIFALLSGVLIFILLAQMSVRKKFQLSREAVIREAAAIELKKDPKNLSIDDYAKIKELKLSRKPLIGISLLEHFTNLEKLEFKELYIPETDLLVWRWEKPKIRILNLSDITPLAKLTKLQILALDGTRISDISPLANKTFLANLFLGNNNITDIVSPHGVY